jgi:hypothetical protein
MKKILLATAVCLAFAAVANACETTTTTRICYSRVYDRAHLAKHPEQTITAMRISLSPVREGYAFFLGIRFRGDKDDWSWKTEGECSRFGPGMTCTSLGNDCATKEENEFFITNKNLKSVYLYPRHIELGDMKTSRVFTKGKDDDIFRLDKTGCWKEEE